MTEIGSFCRGLSRYPELVKCLCQALERLRKEMLGRPSSYATIQLNLSGTHHLFGELKRASRMLRDALSILSPEEYAFVCALNSLSPVHRG